MCGTVDCKRIEEAYKHAREMVQTSESKLSFADIHFCALKYLRSCTENCDHCVIFPQRKLREAIRGYIFEGKATLDEILMVADCLNRDMMATCQSNDNLCLPSKFNPIVEIVGNKIILRQAYGKPCADKKVGD